MTTGLFRTYRYRLLPTKRQHQALRDICENQRQLYNAALQERIDCYRKTGKGRSYIDQCKALTELRQEPEFAAVPVKLQRWTLKRVDEAYKAFFSRLKRGDKAGFPRFRGKNWWKSFGFNDMDGSLRFDGKRLRFKGLPGGMRVHMHRPLPEEAEIKSCVFRRDLKGWHVCFQCAIPAPTAKHRGPAIGLDAGLESFATLSTGEAIPKPQIARRLARELRRRQRALARCRRGSNSRRKVRTQVTRMQTKAVNTHRTFLHQHSARLAREYRLLAVDGSKLTNAADSRAARNIDGAAWGIFIDMLTYKAESANGTVIRVDPGNARRACSGCGAGFPEDSGAGSYQCEHCGKVLDRDHNAALNILALAVAGQGQVNEAACGKRPAGKITRGRVRTRSLE